MSLLTALYYLVIRANGGIKAIRSKLHHRLPTRPTAPSHKKSAEYIAMIREKAKTCPKESCEWLNLLMARFQADFVNTKAMNYYFYTQYIRSFFNFKRTVLGYLISAIDLDKFDVGTEFMRLRNICMPLSSSDYSLATLLAEAILASDMQGSMYMDLIGGIRIRLWGKLKSFVGNLMMEFDREFYSFGFIDKPKIQFECRINVAGYEMEWLNRLLTNRIVPMMYYHKNCLPSLRTRWYRHKPVMPPYPWEVPHDPSLLNH